MSRVRGRWAPGHHKSRPEGSKVTPTRVRESVEVLHADVTCVPVESRLKSWKEKNQKLSKQLYSVGRVKWKVYVSSHRKSDKCLNTVVVVTGKIL